VVDLSNNSIASLAPLKDLKELVSLKARHT
jgi:Leucine-rich repeat (LRR) protein